MRILTGTIDKVDRDGIHIIVPLKDINLDELILRQYAEAQVGLPDSRGLSPGQRAKAHAMISEIANWVGELPQVMKHYMKMDFMVTRMQALQRKTFSLSDCDMTTAREFITYLIDFMIEHGVPSKVPLYEQSEDMEHYIYSCLFHKRCCVCGKKSDLHHVDRVGMGNNRQEIIHEGMLALPLCRKHHEICHTVPQEEFNQQYHLVPIPLDKELCKKYGLKYIAE